MQPPVIPPRYLRTHEAAMFLGLSPRTLEKHRTYGTGPVYRKLGGRVVYAIVDLQQWADSGTVSSTSDPNSKTARPASPQHRTTRRKAQVPVGLADTPSRNIHDLESDIGFPASQCDG
jgi:predicted DNA-binding transcriptional regulator AlpA